MLWQQLKKQFDSTPEWIKLLLLCLLILIPFLGLRALWLPDEGRYAEVAREMLVSGNWLTPQLNFLPHFTKPPLTYWLIAFSLKVFDYNEYAVRLVSALSFTGTVLVTFFLAKEWGYKKSAFWSGVILLTAPIPFIAANVVTPDMLLTLWETLAIFCFWRWYNHQTQGRGYLYGAYAALGLAFMTKGPVGVFIPLLVLVGYALYARDGKIFRQCFSLRGILLFILIALPWYILVILKNEGLWEYFIGQETIGRAFTNIHHRNNTFLIYPLVLLGGFLPWTFYLIPSLKKKYAFSKFKKRLLRPADIFLLSWMVLPLIFFSVVKSRLPLYVLGLFVPLAILTAGYIVPEGEIPKTKYKRLTIIFVVVALLLMGAQAGMTFYPSPQNIYPLIEKIKINGGNNNYQIYSNRDNLYTVNFYLNKKIIKIKNIKTFIDTPSASFMIFDDSRPSSYIIKGLKAKTTFLYRYHQYWLFYHQGKAPQL